MHDIACFPFLATKIDVSVVPPLLLNAKKDRTFALICVTKWKTPTVKRESITFVSTT